MSVSKLGWILFLVLAIRPAPVSAQEQQSDAARRRWTVSGGFLSYGTGGSGCADGYGFAGGMEVNTTGAWLLGVGLGILSDEWPDTCIAIGRLAEYEGRWVDHQGGIKYKHAPQITLRAGRAIRVGQLLIEPALAGGYVRGVSEAKQWREWYGGSIRLAKAGWPLSLQIDRGRHSVPMQYVENRELLFAFEQWEPVTVISLRW